MGKRPGSRFCFVGGIDDIFTSPALTRRHPIIGRCLRVRAARGRPAHVKAIRRMNLSTPESIRQRIQAGDLAGPTVGVAPGFAPGFAQADLVALRGPAALEFLIFCIRNPLACPLLDVLEPGVVESSLAPGA